MEGCLYDRLKLLRSYRTSLSFHILTHKAYRLWEETLSNLPVDGHSPNLPEDTVGLAKMTASEKAAMSGTWRGMGCFQDEMPCPVNNFRLFLCMSPPQQKD